MAYLHVVYHFSRKYLLFYYNLPHKPVSNLYCQVVAAETLSSPFFLFPVKLRLPGRLFS